MREPKTINFTEKGNGYPSTGDVLVNHIDLEAYRVLPSRPGTGEGHIVTRQYHANECLLRVEEVDYEEHFGSPDAWEI
jgi:hypothetical protein